MQQNDATFIYDLTTMKGTVESDLKKIAQPFKAVQLEAWKIAPSSLENQQKDVKRLFMGLFVRNWPTGICKPTKRRSKSCACGALLLDWLSSLKNQQKDALIGWVAWKTNKKMPKSCACGYFDWFLAFDWLRHLGNRQKSIIKFSISNYKALET